VDPPIGALIHHNFATMARKKINDKEENEGAKFKAESHEG
jgi:hypothetical protein